MKKKRVLLLSEGFGAGHTQAAHALAVSLRQLSPDIRTRVLELGAFLHPTLTPWILSAYRKTLTSQPRLVGMMYRYQYEKSLNRLTQLALHQIFYKQTAAILAQLRPNIVVCTHPIPNVIVSRLKRFGLKIPLCTVITDYDAHGNWVNREVNKYLVSSSEVKEKLLQRGIPVEAVDVTGIPVHPNFWEQHNKDEIRKQFNLKNMPTVLIMGGGWGLLDNISLFSYLANWRDQIQLIFCLGTNEKARHKLASQSLFQHDNIHLLGFTKQVDKLMEVSDLLITKPGGMTCTEAMAKGIPMLFHNPIPGQEEENCQYCINHGFGEQLKSLDMIDHWFHLLANQHPSVSNRRMFYSNTVVPHNPKGCSEAIISLMN